MENTNHTLPVEICYQDKSVIKIDTTPQGDIEVRVITKNFDTIANEKGLSFRRKVSSVETAVIFALHWLGKNSDIAIDEFVIRS